VGGRSGSTATWGAAGGCDSSHRQQSNDSGIGSLREAITLSVNGDTINFSSAHDYADQRPTGDRQNHHHHRPAAPGLTVSGNHASRVFTIVAGTVNISDLTVADGRASEGGGGIYVSENGILNLDNCTIAGNESQVGGGGLSNNGIMTLTCCTVSANESTSGGGIMNGGFPPIPEH